MRAIASTAKSCLLFNPYANIKYNQHLNNLSDDKSFRTEFIYIHSHCIQLLQWKFSI